MTHGARRHTISAPSGCGLIRTRRLNAAITATAWFTLISTTALGAELDECFAKAAHRYGIAVELLHAIAAQESRFDPLVVGRNADGSRDIGVMQINTWWLPRLAKYGIGEGHLREPCTNVHVGAWILAGNIARYGYTWDAVGAYNAGTATTKEAGRQRENYARKVATQLVLHSRSGGLRHAAGEHR